MTSISSSMSRVPMMLSSQVLLTNLNRTQSDLLQAQIQMSTGRVISRPSDDIVSASLIGILENEMDRREHRFRALNHADAILGMVDHSIGEVSDLMLEAKSIAAEMVNGTVDKETRKSHAAIVDSLIDELARLANRDYQGVHYFGGDRSAQGPVRSHLGGFEFLSTGGSLKVDIGRASGMPITISPDDAFGAVSARVVGGVDLNPVLTGETRVRDVNGTQGGGVTLGTVKIDLNGLATISVDLEPADSMDDVADLIEDAIAQYETANSVTLLGPGGVGINGAAEALTIDVAAGVTLTFSDSITGTTALDLGLSQATFTTADAIGEPLDPRVTQLTAVSDLAALSGLGQFAINNAGQNRTIDLSAATTVQDVLNLIDAADIGVQATISDDGRSLNIQNTLAGGKMSIYNLPGDTTADQLGVRSVRRDIPLSELNQGRGVQILSGNVDPQTGNPDPLLDRDFVVTLSDGSSFDVDLVGAQTIGDAIDIITAAAPASFSVGIDPGSGGLLLTDSSGGGGTFSVEALNGSFAAQDLGIEMSINGATITGTDPAQVEVESIFTHLLALRDALLDDDTRGITFAGEKFENDINQVAQTRAVVGQRIARIGDLRQREEDEHLLDASMRSQVEDLDYTEASIRFAQLQTSLQASLMTGAQSRNLSLLDFLG